MKTHIIGLFILVASFISISTTYPSVTTSDGLITLDYYEDTQSGIDNRWILDMTVNDVDGPGGIEAIKFSIEILNYFMSYENQYNQMETDYYDIGYMSSGSIPIVQLPFIASSQQKLPTPVNTLFAFYTLPEYEGNLMIDDFYVNLHYTDNFNVRKGEYLLLNGPIGAMSIPEPLSIALFGFGAILLKMS